MTSSIRIPIVLEGFGQVETSLRGLSDMLGKVGSDATRASTGTGSLADSIKRVGHYGSALTLGYSFSQIAMSAIAAADSFTLVDSRIKMVSSSAAESRITQEKLFKVAQETHQSYTELAGTFAQVARSSNEMGISQDRLIGVSKTLSQAINISGSTAESAKAALVQLSQGMASGVLRGEELNSVMEQTPRVAKAIADGLGVSIGELRKLGEQGELTAEKVIGALEKSAKSVATEFKQMTPTVGNAFTELGNSAGNFIDKLNDATRASRGLYNVLSGISWVVDHLSSGLEAGVARGKAGATARTMASLESQINGMDARDPRRKGIEDQLFKLRGKALDGGAEMPVLSTEAKGPPAEFVALTQKLNGVSTDFYKNLNVLHKEYARGGITIEDYQNKVKKLIETETEIGKESKKKKAPGSESNKTPEDSLTWAAKAYAKTMDGINGAQVDADKSTRTLNKAQAELFELMSNPAWEKMPEPWKRTVIEQTAAATSAIEVEQRQKRINDMIAATPTEKTKELQQAMLELESAFLAGEISAEQFSEAAGTKLGTLPKIAEAASSSIETVITNSFQGMADSLADFVLTGKASFGDMVNAMIRDLIRLEFQTQMTTAYKSAGGLSGIMSGIGNWFSGASSPASGGGTAGVDFTGNGITLAGARASGGPVLSGNTYLVGERGPELLTMGAMGGNVTPNNAMGGSSVSIEIHNYSNSQITRKESVDSRGNRRVEVTIGELVASEVSRAGSTVNSAIRGTFGASNQLVTR